MTEETFGLDDDLPEWADEEHGVPADDVDDDPDFEPVRDVGTFPGDPLSGTPFDDPLITDPFGGPAFDDPFSGVIPISGSSVDVGLLNNGVVKWYTQRPRPFTDCMFASLCTTLSFMGYDVPGSFVKELREASEVDRKKPTSMRHTTKAMRKLLPEADLRSGRMSDDELRQRLNSGDICARVMVRNQDLPTELRRFTGDFVGGHAIALAKPRGPGAGPNMVRWLDPMGRPPTYDGIDVAYGSFQDALMRADGLVRVTYGRHNAALAGGGETDPSAAGTTMTAHSGPDAPVFDPDSATIVTNGRQNEFVRIEKGTRFLNPKTLDGAARAAETANFRVAGRTINGKFYGIWVNTRQVKGANGPTLLLVDRQGLGEPFTG